MSLLRDAIEFFIPHFWSSVMVAIEDEAGVSAICSVDEYDEIEHGPVNLVVKVTELRWLGVAIGLPQRAQAWEWSGNAEDYASL